MLVILSYLNLSGCSSKVVLSDPIDVIAICDQYAIQDLEIVDKVKSELKNIIDENPKLKSCDSEKESPARLDILFSEYKFADTKTRITDAVVSLGTLALTALYITTGQGIPLIIMAIPEISITTKNTITYRNKSGVDNFEIKETQSSWFESNEEQIENVESLLKNITKRILNAKTKSTSACSFASDFLQAAPKGSALAIR